MENTDGNGTKLNYFEMNEENGKNRMNETSPECMTKYLSRVLILTNFSSEVELNLSTEYKCKYKKMITVSEVTCSPLQSALLPG